MQHWQLKVALLYSIVVISACSYRYEAIQIKKTAVVPVSVLGTDTITAQVYYTAYIVKIRSSSLLAEKNNEAVNSLQKGDAKKSLALLQEIVTSNDPAVLNNIGIAYILNSNFEKGCEYLYKACVASPNNTYFRKNYLYLHDSKK